MKIIAFFAIFAFSSAAYTKVPSSMDWLCEEKLIHFLGEGTEDMSSSEIIDELQADWEARLSAQTAEFGYCSKRELLKIEINKTNCDILVFEHKRSYYPYNHIFKCED